VSISLYLRAVREAGTASISPKKSLFGRSRGSLWCSTRHRANRRRWPPISRLVPCDTWCRSC